MEKEMEENTNPNLTEQSEGQIETQVIQLLREYFKNRDQIKIDKRARVELWNATEKCDNHNYLTIDDFGQSKAVDCIEALKWSEKPEEVTLCRFCNDRNILHNAIKKLTLRNTAILRSLRAKVV